MLRFVAPLLALTLVAGRDASVVETQRATVAVAAAADLQAMLPQLVSRFERDTGIHATVSYGSSGNFFAQIQNGAPFDVFFSYSQFPGP